jgi:DNA-binding NarL/FixJ family response regulator
MKSKLSATNHPERKVFIVAIHPVLRETLVEIVNRERDLTVCGEASDTGQAFGAIGRVKPELVLVGITVSGKSGFELVEKLRAVDRKIKLLVLCTHNAALYADRVLQSGGNGYIQNQGDPEELIHAIREVLEGRIYVSETGAERHLFRGVCSQGKSRAVRPRRGRS